MVLAEYRPNFVFWTSFVAQLPLQLFFAVWAGAFFGALVRGNHPYLIVGMAALILFPTVTLTAKWLNYSNTVYRIHSDRVEIEEGFLTQHRKEIRLASIREINLRRGILQRPVGLGSVYLATLATGQGQGWQTSALIGGTSTFGSGAMLMDLATPDSAYEQLRELIEARKPPTDQL